MLLSRRPDDTELSTSTIDNLAYHYTDLKNGYGADHIDGKGEKHKVWQIRYEQHALPPDEHVSDA